MNSVLREIDRCLQDISIGIHGGQWQLARRGNGVSRLYSGWRGMGGELWKA